MRYVFVDCRWALDDPGFGRREYEEKGHIPGAVFVDRCRARAQRSGRRSRTAPATCRGRVRARVVGAAGIGAGRLRGRVRLARSGVAERPVVAPPPLRSRGLRRDRARALARAARLGQRDARGSRLRAGTAGRRHDRARRARIAACEELVILDARLPSRFRGEPNAVDRVPGRIPGAVNAPWPEPLSELPPGELVAYCGSGIYGVRLQLHRLHLRCAARVASIPAPGRSGSSIPSCRSNAADRPDLLGAARLEHLCVRRQVAPDDPAVPDDDR